MSKFYLINTIKLGGVVYKSGSLIDDALHPKAAIESAGGTLIASSNSTVAAAAATVQGMWKDGSSANECDPIMANAYAKALDLGHDAIGNATTGVTVNDCAVRNLWSCSVALQAKGVTVHAQDPGGAALALVAGFTNPLPRRTLNIARSDAGPDNVDYTCTVKTPDGGSADIVLTVPRNGDATTSIAGEWTAISTAVDPVSTSDFVTGDGFCLGIIPGATKILSVNGVVEAIVSSDDGSGTIVPTTAPNGAKEFCVQYSSPHDHTITDPQHTHTLT